MDFNNSSSKQNLFNSGILALILVVLLYIAFSGNARYQWEKGMLLDTRRGTVYYLDFDGNNKYLVKFVLEDGYLKRKSVLRETENPFD
ncbi:MAG: hypothetical protein GXZ00_04695 [Synergistaceae bacterium]|nr:hypothetical protein [Synergistaceae bacterium]